RLIAQIGLLHKIFRVTGAASHPIGNGKEQHAIVLERFSLVPFSHGLVHPLTFLLLSYCKPIAGQRTNREVSHLPMLSRLLYEPLGNDPDFTAFTTSERHAKHRETREEILCNIFW